MGFTAQISGFTKVSGKQDFSYPLLQCQIMLPDHLLRSMLNSGCLNEIYYLFNKMCLNEVVD